VLKDLGDLNGARAAYERAIKILEDNLGHRHPQVATGVNNPGLVMKDQGDLNGARAAFERALKIFKKFLPADHPSIKLCKRIGFVGSIAGAEHCSAPTVYIIMLIYDLDFPSPRKLIKEWNEPAYRAKKSAGFVSASPQLT